MPLHCQPETLKADESCYGYIRILHLVTLLQSHGSAGRGKIQEIEDAMREQGYESMTDGLVTSPAQAKTMHGLFVDSLLEVEFASSRIRRTGGLNINEAIEGGYPLLILPSMDPEIAAIGELTTDQQLRTGGWATSQMEYMLNSRISAANQMVASKDFVYRYTRVPHGLPEGVFSKSWRSRSL